MSAAARPTDLRPLFPEERAAFLTLLAELSADESHLPTVCTGWTVHDLRRVVRTGLSALKVAPPVAEFVLGHLPPRMTRTYDRHEPLAEAATALERWARRLSSYVEPEAEVGEVVPFPGAGDGRR